MSNMLTDDKLNQLQEKLNYTFKDIDYLKEALTHSSYANEQNGMNLSCNERLEFLGDAVLSFIASELLFKLYPTENEGDLTQRRANIVSTVALKEKAAELDLASYLVLGKGEEMSNGRNKSSIMANTVEAVIGAVFLDGGSRAARRVIKHIFNQEFKSPARGAPKKDEISLLYELVQHKFDTAPEYKFLPSIGPPHQTKFFVALYIMGSFICEGRGNSKKGSKRDAAKKAISILNEM